MKIGVIGAGNVGSTLGKGWAAKGHEVKFGLQESSSKGDGLTGENISVGSVKEAVDFADVVVLAIPFGAVAEFADGVGSFGDKIVVDCTNPVNATFDGLILSETSGAEALASRSGSKRVVKAFNTVGFNIMANPSFGDRKATMLVCADDATAKEAVMGLASDLGFDPEDAGPLHQAGYLEAFAWVWISMAMKYGHGRDMAFVLHKR